MRQAFAFMSRHATHLLSASKVPEQGGLLSVGRLLRDTMDGLAEPHDVSSAKVAAIMASLLTSSGSGSGGGALASSTGALRAIRPGAPPASKLGLPGSGLCETGLITLEV
eukprot:CAMPEP_0170616906 /NCGR_PEP_ID=MMETSP0224-20130122/26121_1 /TAXON_ID=285029 /ORGANISM="Togula jolla, Strain CCCM 725" /LENGTH=109 /DNA_ID=CAMNT_0010942737 /DNA_START=185 /DNA_END=518 /DNA_ORIENTATION=+